MKYVLGRAVVAGNKILLNGKWLTITSVNETGVELSDGKTLAFNSTIEGWKNS